MKKKGKGQNGAISIFVMMAMTFFLVTIVGVYMIGTKRAQIQTESLGMIQDRYYKEGEENEKYHARIAESTDIIPIYTKEQLWSIGENKTVEIEGKVYDFSQTDLTKYELKNDIIINIDELNSNGVNEPSGIEKNGFEIYYYYNQDYYVLSSDSSSDLSIKGSSFKYKNLSKDLGYVTDGLLLHYDAIKNTAIGHDASVSKWKDLSGNGNDGILSGFNDDANNGWNENYLKLDGTNDSLVTSKEVDYKDCKAITVQFVDCNGILNNEQVAMLFESSSNYGYVNGGYYIDFREFGEENDLVFATKMLGYNLKIGKNILTNQNQVYTIICNNNNEIDNFISFFLGTNKTQIEDVRADLKYDISGSPFLNDKLYIGSRNNEEHFAKMNLASVRIYNKALSQEEIQKNYEIDKVRFGIE